MGALDRYQKPGGFGQLLQLIETCGSVKQEKFLTMVREADPRWSEAIQKKMLTMEKILSWSDEVVSEIAGSLQELTIAIALHGLNAEARVRFYRSFSFSQRRKIDDLFEVNQPSAADIGAAYIKIFTEVRRLMHEGTLRVDRVDPEVFVPDGIEEALRKGGEMNILRSVPLPVPSQNSNPTPAQERQALPKPEVQKQNVHNATSTNASISNDADDNRILRKKILAMTEEINSLKQDVQNLKAKIEHIKKIAA